jgi:mannose/fructose/N-acetylgalactosamine-specific phosphotransferase system component IIC
MTFRKTGIDFTKLNNMTTLNYTDFNLSETGTGLVTDIPYKANKMVEVGGTSYFGLGILVTLFFYLVFKLGDVLDLKTQPYSILRSVGIAGGICGAIGIQMLAIGFFTEFYHVAIFITLLFIMTVWVWYEDKN